MEHKVKMRSLFIGVSFFLIFILLGGKLYWVQVVNASMLQKKAEDLWVKGEQLSAVRGMITDRKGKALAEDSAAYTIALDPMIISERHFERQISKGLASILNDSGDAADQSKLEDKIYGLATKKKADGSGFLRYVEINSEGWKIDGEKKLKVDELIAEIQNSNKLLKETGIIVTETGKRYYPNNNLASHILGFMNKEGKASAGLELSLDSILSGTPGKITHEKDLKGVEIPDSKVSYVPSVNGSNVRLTIDSTIQYYVESALKKAYDQWHPKSMTAIAVDPKTMEILALANAPDFNPNRYGDTKDQKAFINHAVASQYEPGSTFKLVTLAGAIQEGIFHPQDYYQSGTLAVPGNEVHDFNRVGWGKITFMEGLLRSSNVAFAKLGYEGLGKDKLTDYIAKFGFGAKTGVDMPGEVSGRVSFQYPSDVARATFGQAVTVTALQQITAYGAIANGGKLMWPHIIKDVSDAQTHQVTQSFEPKVIRQVVSEETAKQTVLDLEQVVANQELGTGRRAYIDGYRVAGKTGTANIVPEGEKTYSDNTWLISFVGMAPVEDPRIVVAVIADQPDLGGDFHRGGEVAPVVFKEIISQTLKYMNIPSAGTAESKAASLEPTIKVPDVTGSATGDAQKKLTNLGLKTDVLGKGNQVLKQFPEAGSEVLQSQRIYLAAQDSAALDIPDLTGKSLRDVLEIGSFLNMIVKTAGEGYVASQNVSGEGAARELSVTLAPLDQPPQKTDTSPETPADGTPPSGDKSANAAAGKQQEVKRGAASPPPAKQNDGGVKKNAAGTTAAKPDAAQSAKR
jgi:penicillin-binding protein 2B